MAQLERLLRRQRILAWLLSIGMLTITVAFFAMMTMASPLLSSRVLGHALTLANVAAVCIILLSLVSIALYSRQASRVDREMRDAQSDR